VVGWSADLEVEKQRGAFLEVDDAARPGALDAHHRALVQAVSYRVRW